MSSYTFRDAAGDVFLDAPEFARPIPVHAQTPGALAAVASVRRLGVETRLQRVLDALVTDHGRPRVIPYEGDVVTRNARALVALAEAAGFETKLLAFPASCRVEGYNADRALGFRATWTRGRADGATWNTPWRYGIVEDRRPVGVNAKTRTALAGKRGAGMGTTRLAILGSPWGLAITHSELTSRLQEEAS